MKTKLVVLSVASALSLAACNPNQKSTSSSEAVSIATPVAIPTVNVDLSSPDRTLKTLFALQDFAESLRYNKSLETQAKTEKEGDTSDKAVLLRSAAQLFDGLAKKAFDKRTSGHSVSPREMFEREIIKITNETETRSIAIVNIKNITPMPEGATPNKYDKERREKGIDYQYILTKTGQGWKIEDVKEWGYDIESHRETFVRIVQLRVVNNGPRVPSLTDPLF